MSENDSSSSKHSAFAVATAVPWLPLHTTSTFPQHRLLWGQETVDYWSGSALVISKCSLSTSYSQAWNKVAKTPTDPELQL